MGMKINTSVPALNAQKKVTGAAKALQRNLQGMASGLRINQASDDAAGLQAAEMFRTRVRQYTQEANSLQTGINVVQTADDALATQQEGVGRLRELATQAANGTLNDQQREALNQEAQQIIEQIGATGENTEFNGQKLLNGTTGTVDLGTQGGEQVTLNESTTDTLGLNGFDLTTQGGAAAALDQLNTTGAQISQYRASLGAQENRFSRAIEINQTATVNAQESEAMLRDLDVARATTEKSRNEMLLQQSLSALTQSNILPQSASRLLRTGTT